MAEREGFESPARLISILSIPLFQQQHRRADAIAFSDCHLFHRPTVARQLAELARGASNEWTTLRAGGTTRTLH